MGTLGGNGGGGPPPPDGGGPPDGLPELPPEWRSLVVPDDASALADEAAQVRRELFGHPDPRRRPKRALGRSQSGPPTLRLPLIIMAVAVFAALTSLFVVTWPGSPRQGSPGRSTGSATGSPERVMPAIDLLDAAGRSVPVRGLVPAVIMLAEGCACEELISSTTQAVPAGVRVVVVTTSTPPRSTGPAVVQPNLVRLGDPAGGLRSALAIGPPVELPAVVVVAGSGEVLNTVPRAASVDDFRAALALLA